MRDRNICLFGLFYHPLMFFSVASEREEVIKKTKETNGAMA